MVLTFESGIRLTLIEEYIQNELQLKQLDASTYAYGKSFIRITPLRERKLGSCYLPRTELYIWGDALDAEDFQHRFLMRFLSAGG